MHRGDRSRLFNAFFSPARKFIDRHRDGVSKLLIIGGLLIMLFPLATEVYGAISQYELRLEWEERAKEQQSISRKLQEEQLKVYGQRKFEAEESVLKIKSSQKSNEKRAPFPNTRIIIPKIELDQVVLEGTDTEVLKNGPGHYPETVNPGGKGNVGIAGHRVTYTRPFNRLDELAPGDPIIIETIDATYEYKVAYSETRAPSDVTNLKPTGDFRLTLTTCTPKYSAQARLNIIARLYKTTEQQSDVVSAIKSVFEPKQEKKPTIITGDEVQIAIMSANQALEKNPRDIIAHVKGANAYFRIDKYAEAIYHLKVAMELDPGRDDVKRLEKVINEREIQLRQAVKESKAKDLPRQLFSNAELGDMLYAKGDFPGAIEVYEAAARIEPYAADILYYLAMSYEKTGKAGRAVELLQDAVRFSPDSKEAVEALDRLSKKKAQTGRPN
ncbi:MAG: sortase [Actinobacteria bacterium]|nr:sortase [Actinomycetota bacterium]